MNANFRTTLSATDASLVIEGELDLTTREQLRWHLADVELLGSGTVRLDASGVTHVDSACLRAIESTRRRLADAGRELEVRSPSLCFRLVCALAGHAELATTADEPSAVR